MTSNESGPLLRSAARAGVDDARAGLARRSSQEHDFLDEQGENPMSENPPSLEPTFDDFASGKMDRGLIANELGQLSRRLTAKIHHLNRNSNSNSNSNRY